MTTRTPKREPSFGESFEQLERIATQLEGDTLELDDAIEKFERGLELANQLKEKLKHAEQRVERIKQRFSTTDLGADEARSSHT